MLFLIFELGSDRYAIDTSDVVEVLARAPLKALPGTPPWVSGLCSYRGHTVPVIDLCELALGRPASDHISTRTVMVHYRSSDASTESEPSNAQRSESHWLGLVVEHANRTQRFDAADFRPGGIDTPDARWLGPVAQSTDGLVQWVRIEHLLTDEARELLFTEANGS
jgi:chemotaxis-related protein WspB